MCRSTIDSECDLPEFCNGSSSLCQSDVFVQVTPPEAALPPGGAALRTRCPSPRSLCELTFCLCFRTGSRAGTSRRTATTGSVSSTTDSVRTYLEPVRTEDDNITLISHGSAFIKRDTVFSSSSSSEAKAAPEICFKDVNSKGDRFGNCGYHNYGYKKCESR